MTGKKLLKKFACAALAGVSVFASLATFSACTTSHPEVEMKISFNDKTYTLNYKLYRKIAPSTVQHFLELVEQEYYNGICVHDYSSSKLATGGYTYDETRADDEGGLVLKPYFETLKAIEEEKNMKFTQTVWADEERTDPVYTVYGEFSDNGFKVENSTVKQSYGSLTMYYTPKDKCVDNVYVKRADGSGYDWKAYKYNSATSLFYISLNSSSASSGYCTFATLKDSSVETLESLVEAIADYIADEYEEDSSEFAPSTVVRDVDEGDRFMESARESQTYSIPRKPIVIESAKVTKY